MSRLFVFRLFTIILLSACAPDGPLAPRSPLDRRGSTVDLDGRTVSGPARQIAARPPEQVSSLSASSRDQISPDARPIADLALYPLYGDPPDNNDRKTGSSGAKGEVNALAVTKDGNTAYIGGSDGSMFAATFNKPDGKNNQGGQRTLSVSKIFQSKHPIVAAALSVDERYLAIAQYSAVYIVDLQSRQVTNTMTQVEGRILSLAWDPRQALLLMGRASGEIFAWRLRGANYAGENSREALEQYGTAGSAPVIGLAFHPSGRAFIAATQDGDVTLWRLLRTETELGIRDESAVVDEDRKGSKEVSVGRASGQVQDLWFDTERQEILVSTVDGNISRWLLRGLEQESPMNIGADSTKTFQGVSTGENAGFLIAAGRGQKLKVFCRAKSVASDTLASGGGVQIIPSENKESADDAEQGTRIIGGRLVLSQEEKKAPAPVTPESDSGKARVVAESPTLRDPISQLRIGGTMLWAVQKKGNLLVFDARPTLSAVAGRCPQS